MTDTAVTPLPGVTRRSDSTVWSFVLRAPKDLFHRFDGKPWAVRRSLKTSDLREANAKARVLQAEWAQTFDAMRREDNPQRVERNAALVATIAAEMRRWMLQADDNLRDYPAGPAAMLKAERRRLIAEGNLTAAIQYLDAMPAKRAASNRDAGADWRSASNALPNRT